MTPRPTLFLLATVLLAVPAVQAQDLSGAWDMETSVHLPLAEASLTLRSEHPPDCVYAGPCVLDQDGEAISGTMILSLVSGDESCPAEMTADITGGVGNGFVEGNLSGPLGAAAFAGEETNSFAGTFVVQQGDFAGATGSWFGERQQLVSVLEIPFLSGLGLALLTLALIGASAWAFRSQIAS